MAGLLSLGLKPAWPSSSAVAGAPHSATPSDRLGLGAPSGRPADGWLLLDARGLLFLSITSALFLVVSIYALDYFRREDWGRGRRQDFEEGFLFTTRGNPPSPAACSCSWG
jgi:formate hydrogenlyase subunit 3/multisubunit Na+/H+ antiporter MnhD subunit